MPVRISLDEYLTEYHGSIQEQDPTYYHRVSRLAHDVAEEARTMLSAMTGDPRTTSLVTGTEIEVETLKEEAENAPIDLKPGLLFGRSSKVSKKGVRYAVVPFRKKTPGRGKYELETLPRDIYRAAVRGQPILPSSEMGQRFQRTGYGGEEWMSGPFANLTRYAGTFRGGGRYFTFRTVSENSPPLSWIRPPFLRNQYLSQRVESLMNQRLPDMVRSALGEPYFPDSSSPDEFI